MRLRGIALLGIVLGACGRDVPTDSSEISGADESLRQQVRQRLREAKRVGLDTIGATVTDDHIILEGDIAILIRSAIVAQGRPNEDVNVQARRTFLLRPDFGAVSEISINLTALFNKPAWAAGARLAIDHWNAVRGSAVRLRETTTTPSDITVRVSALSSGTYATATLPTGWTATGRFIDVNASTNSNPYGSANPPATQQNVSNMSYVMVHEIGHNLGLLHTNNWTNGELVPGTSNADVASIMWSTIASGRFWPGFSIDDIFSIRSTWLGQGPSANVNANTLSWSANDPDALGYDIVRYTWVIPPWTNEQYPEGVGYAETIASLSPSDTSFAVTTGTQGCDRYNQNYVYAVATRYPGGIVSRPGEVTDCFSID